MTALMKCIICGLLFVVLVYAEGKAQDASRAMESPMKQREEAENQYELGNEALVEERYEDALLYFDQAISLRPSNYIYHMARAQCQESMGDHMKALIDYETVIRINPENTNAYFKRGWIRYLRENYSGAIKDFTFIIDGEGSKETTSIIFKGVQQNEGGTTTFAGVTTIDKLKADSYNARALAYAKDANHEKAFQDYDMAISLNPDDPNYYVNRGLLKRELEDIPGAKLDYKKALEVFPGHKTALYNLSLIAEGDELTSLNSELYAEGNLAVAFSKRAYERFIEQDYEGALMDYDSALVLRPGNAEDLMNRGLAKSKLGLHAQAIADYSKSLESKQTLTRNYVLLGNAYQGLTQYQEAIDNYQLYLLLETADPTVFYNKGIAEYRSGQYESACRDLKKAFELGESKAKKPMDQACRD